jgi:hypothetical protein
MTPLDSECLSLHFFNFPRKRSILFLFVCFIHVSIPFIQNVVSQYYITSHFKRKRKKKGSTLENMRIKAHVFDRIFHRTDTKRIL